MDVGVVIALSDEFDEFFRQLGSLCRPERDKETGGYYYLFDYPSTNPAHSPSSPYHCVATFAGQMGAGAAALLTQRLILRWRPRTVVNLGIAGGIKDVHLGDVVVGTQVDNYLDRSKAVAQTATTRGVPEDRFEVVLGGEVYRTSASLIQTAFNLPFAHGRALADWKERCHQNLSPQLKATAQERLRKKGLLGLPDDLTPKPGHVASGPTVGAAPAFTQWLLQRRDRNLLCLEMEAGGILEATHQMGSGLDTLILRGISDMADADKAVLESQYKGVFRDWAMHNAVQLLRVLLEERLLLHKDPTEESQERTATSMTARNPTESPSIYPVENPSSASLALTEQEAAQGDIEEKVVVDYLEGLAPPDFQRILVRLPEASRHLSDATSHYTRVAALMEYVRARNGPGMARLVEILKVLFPSFSHLLAEIALPALAAPTPSRVFHLFLKAPDGETFETDVPSDVLVAQLHADFLLQWADTERRKTSRFTLKTASDAPPLDPTRTLAEEKIADQATLYLIEEPIERDSPVGISVEDREGHRFVTTVRLDTPIQELARAFLSHSGVLGESASVELVTYAGTTRHYRPLQKEATLFDERIGPGAQLRILSETAARSGSAQPGRANH